MVGLHNTNGENSMFVVDKISKSLCLSEAKKEELLWVAFPSGLLFQDFVFQGRVENWLTIPRGGESLLIWGRRELWVTVPSGLHFQDVC